MLTVDRGHPIEIELTVEQQASKQRIDPADLAIDYKPQATGPQGLEKTLVYGVDPEWMRLGTGWYLVTIATPVTGIWDGYVRTTAPNDGHVLHWNVAPNPLV